MFIWLDPSYNTVNPAGADYSVKKGNKYGLIDSNGDILVPIEYTDFNRYNSDCEYLAFAKDGKWGYLDRRGIEIIPFIYESADSFNSDELGRIKMNGKWGYIDKTGVEVIPIVYDAIGKNLNEERVVIVEKDGRTGTIDITGKVIIPIKYDVATYYNENENYFNYYEVLNTYSFKGGPVWFKRLNRLYQYNIEGELITTVELSRRPDSSSGYISTRDGEYSSIHSDTSPPTEL